KSDLQQAVQQAATSAVQSQINSRQSAQPGSGKVQPGGLDDTRQASLSTANGTFITQQGMTSGGAASFSDTSGGEVVFVNQSGTGMGLNAVTTGTVAVNGTVSSATGVGIYGSASSTAGTAAGVRGDTAASGGQGVIGFASSTSGSTAGVSGQAVSATGTGVQGQASGSSGVGIHGTASSPIGSGVGVMGETLSPSGTAGLFNVSQSGAKILTG